MSSQKVHLELGAANEGPTCYDPHQILLPLIATLDELLILKEPWKVIINDIEHTNWVCNVALEYISKKKNDITIEGINCDYTSLDFPDFKVDQTHLKNPPIEILNLIAEKESFIHRLISNSKTGVEVHSSMQDILKKSVDVTELKMKYLGPGSAYYMPILSGEVLFSIPDVFRYLLTK